MKSAMAESDNPNTMRWRALYKQHRFLYSERSLNAESALAVSF